MEVLTGESCRTCDLCPLHTAPVMDMRTSYPLLSNRFPQTKQLTTMPTHQLTGPQARTGPWCGGVLLRMSQGQIRLLAEAALLS